MNYMIGDTLIYQGETVTIVRYTSQTSVLVAASNGDTFSVELDALD